MSLDKLIKYNIFILSSLLIVGILSIGSFKYIYRPLKFKYELNAIKHKCHSPGNITEEFIQENSWAEIKREINISSQNRKICIENELERLLLEDTEKKRIKDILLK